MEHIPRPQSRSSILLESCLYVLSMNMFVLPVYLHVQGIRDHFGRKIAVGGTNRRDQQKARFIAFVVPF